MKNKANVAAKIMGGLNLGVIAFLLVVIATLFLSVIDDGWIVILFLLMLIPIIILVILFILNLIFYIRLLRGKRSLFYIVLTFISSFAALIISFMDSLEPIILIAYSLFLLIFAILMSIDRKKYRKVKKEEARRQVENGDNRAF